MGNFDYETFYDSLTLNYREQEKIISIAYNKLILESESEEYKEILNSASITVFN